MKKLVWAFFWCTIAAAVLLFAQTTVNTRVLRLTANPTVQPCSFSVFGLDVTNQATWFCEAGSWFRAWAAPGPPTAADQVVSSSASGSAAWRQVNGGSSCGDGNHAVNYTAGSTHGFGCQTLTTTAMVRIAQTILGSPASTFSFSSIPNTYTDLRLSIVGRTSESVASRNVYIQFNSDTGTNYNWQFIDANDVSVASQGIVSSAQPVIGVVDGASATASIPGSIIVEIPVYAGTTFFKQSLSRSYIRTSTTTGSISLFSLAQDWASTSAISSITIGLTAAGNFVTGSTATLWGIQ